MTASHKPELDVVCVVPVYNEAIVLAEAIGMLVRGLEAIPGIGTWQIVIASNGCTDRTDEVGRELENTYDGHVKLIVCQSRGRGLALREVLADVKAKHYMYIDVDLPCEVTDLAVVLAPLHYGADLVVSHRTGYRPWHRRLMTLGLRSLNQLVFGVRVSDSQCAVKALSPKAVKILVDECRQPGWFLDTELVVLTRTRQLEVAEVPIHWVEKRFKQRESKVDNWRDSWRALKALRQIRNRQRSQQT